MTGQVPALRTACERKRKRWLVIWRLRIKTLRGLETFERNALSGPAGLSLSGEYTKVLKGLLNFHSQVLTALGRQSGADIKLEQQRSFSLD